MCLAEALLRVPDAETMDALIEDKIAPSDWGKASGPFVLVAGQRLDLGADADRPRAGRGRAGRAGHLRGASSGWASR
jgi:RHH-type transcriptional regulator, proline utilization regulon repressor / proline dehydrogenase / delta 1-pyrroline-5-carboxylate dehydrogenase